MKMPTDAIREEILKSGAIPFARFMELALYCPETGYYEKNQDNVGRAGDFITSVSVGSLFGELLAFQFAEWLTELRSAECGVRIIEAGAHDGKLAKDILNWLQTHRPQLFSEIEYVIIEPSERRQQWQRETLMRFPNVCWFANFQSVAADNPQLNGIIFSNELLDAFPVRRLGWDGKEKNWFEWGVTLDGGKFGWTKMWNAECRMQNAELEAVLPDNYTVEISPAAENWWRAAAGILARGKLLAIDYGFNSDEQFSPARLKGTLRAYHRHQVSNDLLANPGEQDLTAHVNFSAVQKVGEEAGLKTETFCTQPQFLTRILQKAVKEKTFTSLDAKQIRQFQTLTHPEHLGRAFRVLVQSRA
jgi:SAM-dependent MidA family methyltransferase